MEVVFTLATGGEPVEALGELGVVREPLGELGGELLIGAWWHIGAGILDGDRLLDVRGDDLGARLDVLPEVNIIRRAAWEFGPTSSSNPAGSSSRMPLKNISARLSENSWTIAMFASSCA